MMVRTVVVLPAPLRPISAALAPAFNSKLTLRKTGAPSSATLIFSRLSIASYSDYVLADFRIGQNLRRRTDLLNFSHAPDGNPIGIAFHHVHVVLDKDRSDLLPCKRTRKEIHDAEFLGRGDTGGRLVHEQEPGFERKRKRDIDELALSFGQFSRLAARKFPNRHEIEQALHLRRLRQTGESPQTRRSSVQRSGRDQHVLHHGLIEKELRNLKGARDAEPGDGAWQLCGDIAAKKTDAARLRPEVTSGDVEERGFAGAVWPDNCEIFALINFKIDSVG